MARPQIVARFGRAVLGFSGALRMHGVFGASRRTVSFLRAHGLRATADRMVGSLRAHAALGGRPPARPNAAFAQLDPAGELDLHNRFLVGLGHRGQPRRPRTPHLVVISDTTLQQCQRYRIDNKIAALKMRGLSATYAHADDLFSSLSAIQFASAIIFYRMAMSERFMVYCDEANRLGLPTYYDIDDPMFDREVISANVNTNALEPHISAALYRDALTFRHAMACCDRMLASTPALADMMSAATGGKAAFVWRNAADEETLRLSDDIADARRAADSRIRIGYFSGSLAHEADFDVAAPALVRLMRTRSDVDLALFGHVKRRVAFDAFEGRVFTDDFADYDAYLRAVGNCDLVVIPLVDNAFNRCKSIVRFIDAALLRIPVVASRVGDYAALIRDRDTGWLADVDEWDRVLTAACADAAARRRIGDRARRFIEDEYSVAAYMPALDEAGAAAIFGSDHASSCR